MSNAVKYRLRKAGNILICGIKYEFNSQNDSKITIYSSKFPKGRVVNDMNEEMQLLSMFNHNHNLLDFEPVNEQKFNIAIKSLRN